MIGDGSRLSINLLHENSMVKSQANQHSWYVSSAQQFSFVSLDSFRSSTPCVLYVPERSSVDCVVVCRVGAVASLAVTNLSWCESQCTMSPADTIGAVIHLLSTSTQTYGGFQVVIRCGYLTKLLNVPDPHSNRRTRCR